MDEDDVRRDKKRAAEAAHKPHRGGQLTMNKSALLLFSCDHPANH